MENPTETRTMRGGAGAQTTIAALFEEAVDAEHALIAFRKAEQSADRISLLVRSGEDEPEAEGAADVARDIVAAALGAVARWLSGLAELIVSDRGRYLVAGPMGAALTGIGRDQQGKIAQGAEGSVVAANLNADSLPWVLTEFGFSPKEAAYIEHRLAAGATLVAMTTADAADLERGRRLFSDHGAVYIDEAETSPDVLATTEALLAAAPAATGSAGDGRVADVAVRIRPVASGDQQPDLVAMRGRDVCYDNGDEAGHIELVLVEEIDHVAGGTVAGAATPRYVVVSFGGVLGLGRRHAAIPVQLVELATDPAQVRLGKTALSRAPAYDEDVPLGRREEERIFHFYGIAPYWTAPERSAPAPVSSIGEQDDRAIERR